MDHSVTFARHFGRLVWLLMNESGSVDEQKMSLRAAVTVSRVGPVRLTVDNWELRADDAMVPGALTGVRDVASQMTAHSIRSAQISTGVPAADLLGLARIIAAGASANDGGAEVLQKLTALRAGGIVFTTIPPVPGRPGQTIPVQPVAPAQTLESAPPPEQTSEPAPPPAQTLEPAPPPAAAPVAASPAATVPAISGPRALRDSTAALIAQMSGRDVSALTPEELLRALDKTAAFVDESTRLLDDLVTLAEHSMRVGKPKIVADVLHGIVTRETKLEDGDVRRAYVMTVRQLSKPALLRAVASLVVKYPERKQYCFEILERTGEDGAAALIEQVGQARSTDERQTLLEVLVELPDAVPALIKMLGDSRWFVVRNAADLLGEMVATNAEDALIAMLRHTDDRVRRSVTNALLRLGTPDAVKGVYDAVGDSSPEVRMQVASAIANRRDAKTSATLIRAIEGEDDGDVQLAIIAALGKVATPDAVQKLIKMAEPEGRLFRKKDSGLRVAAVQALGDARTPAALTALKELAADKDRDVRDTATRALTQAGR